VRKSLLTRAVVVNVEMPAMTEIRPAQLSPQRNGKEFRDAFQTELKEP